MSETLPEGILDTPEFAAFFSADQDPITRTFKVGDLEGYVTLRPMDSGDLERFQLVGVKTKLTQEEGGKQKFEVESIDQAERSMFLVAHTLLDWQIPTRKKLTGGRLGEWELLPAPERQDQRETEIRKRFRCVPAVWEWLVRECRRVNGMEEDTAKNSG